MIIGIGVGIGPASGWRCRDAVEDAYREANPSTGPRPPQWPFPEEGERGRGASGVTFFCVFFFFFERGRGRRAARGGRGGRGAGGGEQGAGSGGRRAVGGGRNADFREDADGEDDHAGRGVIGHYRQREGQDPGQGGHPAGPAAADLRGQAAGGRPDAGGLQYPEGVHAPPGAPSARREAHRREDDDKPPALRLSGAHHSRPPAPPPLLRPS